MGPLRGFFMSWHGYPRKRAWFCFCFPLEFMSLGNVFTGWNLYFRSSVNKLHLNHIRWTIFCSDFYCSKFSFPRQPFWGGRLDQKSGKLCHLINGGLPSSPSEKVDDSSEEWFSSESTTFPPSHRWCSSRWFPHRACSSWRTFPLKITFSLPPSLSPSSLLLLTFFSIFVLLFPETWGKEKATFVCGDKGGQAPIWKLKCANNGNNERKPGEEF